MPQTSQTPLSPTASSLDRVVLNSHTSRLAVEYSHNATPGAPAHLILKRNASSEWGVEAGLLEMAFYRRVAELHGHPPITVSCYAAEADPDTGDSYLLLQDLSPTHAAPLTRDQVIGIVESVPPAWAIEAVAGTLASLHAYWWDHPSMATDEWETGYWTRNVARYAAYLACRTASWEALWAAEGTSFRLTCSPSTTPCLLASLATGSGI